MRHSRCPSYPARRRAARCKARRAWPAPSSTRQPGTRQGARWAEQDKASVAQDSSNPSAGLPWLKGCSSLLPSKEKERTPELGSARWGGSSAPLILGTRSSLGSQGASSPVHPALTLGTPGFGRAPSLPGALKGHYPDPAAPPSDPSEQPRSWPGSGERGKQPAPHRSPPRLRGRRQRRSTGAPAAPLRGKKSWRPLQRHAGSGRV